jgi:hypothetical protein
MIPLKSLITLVPPVGLCKFSKHVHAPHLTSLSLENMPRPEQHTNGLHRPGHEHHI